MEFKRWLGDAELDEIRYGETREDRGLSGKPTPLFGGGWRGYEMPEPPRNSSAETLSEIAAMLRRRGRLGEVARRERAAQDRGDLESIFVALLEGFGEEVPPALRRLIPRVSSELATIGLHFKERFGRARPWQVMGAVGARVAGKGRTTGSPSYPSNHALIGTFMALWLSSLYPRLRGELRMLGRSLGDNRNLGEFHYRSDVESGNELAEWLWARFGDRLGRAVGGGE